MKILNLSSSGGAGFFHHRAQMHAAQALGHEWIPWSGDILSLEHTQPDLVITDVARQIPFERDGSYKLAMIVRQWSDNPMWPEVVNRGYGTTWTDVGYVETVDPDCLYHHGTPQAIKQGFNLWEENVGRKVTSIPMAADIHYYWRDIKPFDERKYDISWVGSMWPYKANTMVPYLLPLFQNQLLRSVVYGKDGWFNISNINYRGFLDLGKEGDLYEDTIVVPCCHEPHSQRGGDIVQRFYNPIAAGAFVVSDWNPSIAGPLEFEFTPTCVNVAKSPQDMQDKVHAILNDPNAYVWQLEQARGEILAQHTYEHRLGSLFLACGLFDDAADAFSYAEHRHRSHCRVDA